MQLDENTLPLAIQKDIEALKAWHRGEKDRGLGGVYILNFMAQLTAHNGAMKSAKKLLTICVQNILVMTMALK